MFLLYSMDEMVDKEFGSFLRGNQSLKSEKVLCAVQEARLFTLRFQSAHAKVTKTQSSEEIRAKLVRRTPPSFSFTLRKG